MTVSTVEALLPWRAEQVWQVVTDLRRTGWRSDLSRVEERGPAGVCGVHQRGSCHPVFCHPGPSLPTLGIPSGKRQPPGQLDGGVFPGGPGNQASLHGKGSGQALVDDPLCQGVSKAPAGPVHGGPEPGAGTAAWGKVPLKRAKKQRGVGLSAFLRIRTAPESWPGTAWRKRRPGPSGFGGCPPRGCPFHPGRESGERPEWWTAGGR